MSVIGFDFGNENCFIAVARAGGIETIANEYSQRVTPSYVAFGDRIRDLGVSAKNKQVTNVKNTVYGFKRLIGRRFNDPQVKRESQVLPFTLVEMPNGDVGVSVRFANNDTLFSITQITAMLFTKLKEVAEQALRIKVNDCVISVPFFYTDSERRALLDASKIAGLNCLKLMNETTAVALSYGFYKNDLPEDKAKIVAFIDMGHAAMQVSIVAFNKDKLKILACAHDAIGGRDFDNVLVRHFCTDFAERYKLDVPSNKRALIRLTTECEKLKKQMSANALDLPLNIECFMQDKDVSGKMKRETFEHLSADVLARTEKCIQRVVAQMQTTDPNFKLQDIETVEIVGGSTRIPSVKAIVKKVLGREPSTTLNADEAVSRGCALQCAMLSPIFKVRDFTITDLQPYAVSLRYQPLKGEEGGHLPDRIRNGFGKSEYPVITADDFARGQYKRPASEMEVFSRNHQIPYSKMLTFYRSEPFTLDAAYSPSEQSLLPYPDRHIGTFKVAVNSPSGEGQHPDDKIKVKVRINLHGIFSVVSATLLEKTSSSTPGLTVQNNADLKVGDQQNGEVPMEAGTEQPQVDGGGEEMMTSQQDDDVTVTSQQLSQEGGANGAGEEPMETDIPNVQAQTATNDAEPPKDAKKKAVRSIDIPVECDARQLKHTDLQELMEREMAMISSDRSEKERVDAKNAVEEYVYEMRDALGDRFAAYVSDAEKTDFTKQLSEAEDWLYGEGEDVAKNAYVDKLEALKRLGEPLRERHRENEERPRALEEMSQALMRARKAVTSYQAGEDTYDHIPKEDIERLAKALEEKQQWFDRTVGKLSNFNKHLPPPITCGQIRDEKRAFENVSSLVLNKPKPKVSKSNDSASAAGKSEAESTQEGGGGAAHGAGGATKTDSSAAE